MTTELNFSAGQEKTMRHTATNYGSLHGTDAGFEEID
jgi:hypothetical protein